MLFYCFVKQNPLRMEYIFTFLAQCSDSALFFPDICFAVYNKKLQFSEFPQ